MSKSLAVAILVVCGVLQPAFAEDWIGQTPPPAVSGPIGPLPTAGLNSDQVVLRCGPSFALPPPCGPGETPSYYYTGAQQSLDFLPAAAGPGSNMGVSIHGFYADPASPTGWSNINGYLPLDAFARSTTVDGLSSSFNNLSSTVNTLSTQLDAVSLQVSQFQQQLMDQNSSLRQGVAVAIAMAGTGDIDVDQRISISLNWGTYGGENAIAGGVTLRASDRLVFSGGFGTGFQGGLVGGRAGARIGW